MERYKVDNILVSKICIDNLALSNSKYINACSVNVLVVT